MNSTTTALGTQGSGQGQTEQTLVQEPWEEAEALHMETVGS